MKIAINGLSISSGGGITYLFNFLPALGALDRQNHYYIFLSRFNVGLVSGLPENFHLVTVRLPFNLNLLRGIYEQVFLPRRLKKEKIDLLYSPADITSLSARCPVVLAMRNPNLYTALPSSWSLPNRARLAILKWLARKSARRATGIIFVSRSSLEEIAAKLAIPREKCYAIHHGIDPGAFTRGNVKALPRHLPRRYLLSISTIYHYKNYLRLLEAYRNLRRERGDGIPPLLIAGGNADAPYYRKMLAFISENSLTMSVFLPGNFSYPLVPSLYAGAAAFIFPSYLETFGHPSLEAMAAGVPVAASDIPVMREVLGEAAVYFAPHDVGAIENAVRGLLDDEGLRGRLIKLGRERARSFTWSRTARETLELFQRMGGTR